MGYKEYEKYLKEHPDKKAIFDLSVEIEVVLELLVDNKLSKKEKEYIKSINSCNDTFKGLFKM